MGGEGNVLDSHFDCVCFFVKGYLLGSIEETVTKSAFDAVSRNDESVSLVFAPLFEDLNAGAWVEHAWSCKKDIGSVSSDEAFIKGFNFFEFENIVS